MLVLKREEGKGLEKLKKGVEYFVVRNIKLMRTKKGYSSLFRAGVFLCLTLAVVNQFVFINFLPYDKEAHALMYKVEFQTKTEYESPDELMCSSKEPPKVVYIDCKNAQYLYSTSSAWLKLRDSLSDLFCIFIGIAFFMSLVGFLLREPDDGLVIPLPESTSNDNDQHKA